MDMQFNELNIDWKQIKLNDLKKLQMHSELNHANLKNCPFVNTHTD